ncbi:NACHT, LRR and PYD domains-containing protein 3-like [Acanthaster planci]|uniref:NACHT, LRR and PYD domains-containing protein 3-like n=1 Tax=Acanthaster planci TaxID=133434 RepID=A0A8B7ZD84_ACAPL|nr:NACHT, LRR and PYD domains-containing protein 3-like [Acanthaster planci]
MGAVWSWLLGSGNPSQEHLQPASLGASNVDSITQHATPAANFPPNVAVTGRNNPVFLNRVEGSIFNFYAETPKNEKGHLGINCAEQLKTYYLKEMSTIPIHPILLSTTRKIKDIFIQLLLRKETHRTRRAEKGVRLRADSKECYPDNPIMEPLKSQDDLMQLLIDDGHVVVVGTAGKGKTTLTRKIAYDWTCHASDSCLSLFKLVFVLRMKEIQVGSGILDSMRKILPTDVGVSRRHLQHIIHENQREVLIIFDGLDEASSTVLEGPVHDDDYPIKDVLSAKALRNCSVLVTTRPHKMDQLRSYFKNYTVVETTGFSSDNRNKYIQQFFSDDKSIGEALIKEVDVTAFIHTLAQCPIMLLLLCLIWNHDQTLPQRLTELYERAVNVLVDHLSSKGSPNLHDPTKMDALIEVIGRVAFEGLINPLGERLVFSPEEFSNNLEYAFQIGILFQETRIVVEHIVRTINFLHKSFQEFFAAKFLALKAGGQIREKLLPLVTLETIQEKEYLLRFCCGMNQEAACAILEHINGLSEDLQTPAYLWIQSFSLVLVFEAQSPDLVKAVGSRLTLKYKEDFSAMVYFLQWLPDFVRLDRLNIHVTHIHAQAASRSILEQVRVDSLYFHLDLTSMNSGQFLNQLTALRENIASMPHQPHATRLYLTTDGCDNHSNTEECNTVGIQISQLSCFFRENQTLKNFGIGLAGNIIRSEVQLKDFVGTLVSCKATYLCIDDNDLHGSLGILSPLFQTLTSLVLRRCSLTDDDMNKVSRFVTEANNLTCLYFHGGNFSQDAVYTLIDAINQNESIDLEKLYLCDIDLDPSLVSRMVLEKIPHLKEFKTGFFAKRE